LRALSNYYVLICIFKYIRFFSISENFNSVPLNWLCCHLHPRVN